MAIRIRRDVHTLPDWDPILEWYAKAIARMQERPLTDSCSWRYQAAVHEFNGNAAPDEIPADADTYWNQCQHHSWFFLPWHRWYLLYFESVIIDAIKELGGPHETWALPYWNYSDGSAKALRLPKSFTDETLNDDGVTPNPLRVEKRSKAANEGRNVTDAIFVALDCLKEPKFVAPASVQNIAGFGGPVTGFNHAATQPPRIMGKAEQSPHNTIHGAVGGPGGFMSSFATAGLDPMFWLHHANIDRLWAVWRNRDARHTDPTESKWLDDIQFPFRDGSGAPVIRTAREAVDTAPLGYEYEDVSDPLAAPEAAVLSSVAADETATFGGTRMAEMIGSTDEPVRLTTQTSSAEVQVEAPSGPALLSVDETPRRVIVTLENVRGNGTAMNYAVYVNGKLAGVLPMFGVREASQAGGEHGGAGLEFRFDVTDVVREAGLDPGNLQVTFVPDIDPADVPDGPSLLSAEEEPAFEVGRVSVFLA